MALADITLVLEYIPFLAYTQLIGKPGGWGWAAYLWFHSNFSVVIHNVSVWLTLTVAVWRFIMIKYHTWVPVYCTMERCHLVMLSAYGKWNSSCVKIHLSSVQKWQNWHHACEGWGVWIKNTTKSGYPPDYHFLKVVDSASNVVIPISTFNYI